MNVRKLSQIALAATFLLTFSLNAASTKVAVVDFNTCLLDSKYGKEEQESFETLKSQMTTLIGDVEKQLGEIANKLNDPDHLDSLSPDAERELNVQFQTLSEELNRYQQQFYQVLNQAYMKMNQSISGYITEASAKVAKSDNLDYILNKDACFYYNTNLDVTTSVISDMDKLFDKESSKKTSTTPAKNGEKLQANAEGAE
ncbi:MAG: OmpH family outer membrane protein [Simkaniaceae bacterium]|nr:OmpH family outer membrane protein [Simkaniaceae bacterium]